MALAWEKIAVETEDGSVREGIAPLILSASRATDIPAFHAAWFMRRLERGYFRWVNPFNPMASQYVSTAKTRAVVFWTKNPEPMFPYLHRLDERGLGYYYQFTLNDYEREGFEPGVPPLEKRIETFAELSRRIGKERVIWRFDPLLPAPGLGVPELMERVFRLGERLVLHTDRLSVGFADVAVYPSVRRNLIRCRSFFTPQNIGRAEFTDDMKRVAAEALGNMQERWRRLNPDFRIVACAEPLSLEEFGIGRGKCIDDDLLIRLFPQDKALMDFLGYRSAPDGGDARTPAERKRLKDPGQRKACGCVRSKDIGSYATCSHLCVYCYANASPEKVVKNLKRLRPESDSLLPAGDE